jgi:hypothetical protein
VGEKFNYQFIRSLVLMLLASQKKDDLQGRRNWGGGGAVAPVALYQEGQGGGAKVPFQFTGLPWQNSELSEMFVQFVYEFASENAKNAVTELQE